MDLITLYKYQSTYEIINQRVLVLGQLKILKGDYAGRLMKRLD